MRLIPQLHHKIETGREGVGHPYSSITRKRSREKKTYQRCQVGSLKSEKAKSLRKEEEKGGRGREEEEGLPGERL